MTHILPTKQGEVAAYCRPGQNPVRLKIAEGPYHTDVRASIVYLSNEQGERFRVEVRRG